MAEKNDINVFGKIGLISSWVKWGFGLICLIFLFIIGGKFYGLVKDCWTCSVFETLYDAFSSIAYYVYDYFSDKLLIVISVCLALWIAWQTLLAFGFNPGEQNPSVNFMTFDAPKFDENYFKTIYKKMFLAVAVIGLFLLNNPRNVFSNTLEITLDFGSNVSREFLRKKDANIAMDLPECQNYNSEIIYKDDKATLSENTKNDMVCMMKEINVLRQDYMDLGIELFEYGRGYIITTVSIMATEKLAMFIGGKILRKYGSKAWLKNKGKHLTKFDEKLDDISKKLQNATGAEKDRLLADKKRWEEARKRIVDAVSSYEQKSEKDVKKINQAGKVIQKSASTFAFVTGLISFFTNEHVRMGIAGFCLIIGLFGINLYFGFIIIEKMLYLGISIILMPLLAVCYLFDTTRKFATSALSSTLNFAIGLIFMCIAMVMCSEINDWILGGMFSNNASGNITTTQEAINLIRSGKVKEFTELVGSYWYFLYIILMVGIDGLLITHAKDWASSFGNGSIQDSGIAKRLKDLGKSTKATFFSLGREVSGYLNNGKTTASKKGEFFDYAINKVFKRGGKNE